MTTSRTTKTQLIQEQQDLRHQIAELEQRQTILIAIASVASLFILL